MNVRVIINPSAGRQTVQKQAMQIVNRMIKNKIFDQVEIIKTRSGGDAFKAAYDFQPWQVDLLMAVGGDGTVNEVINGLIEAEHKTPLSILPAGTVNDFAHAMEIPKDTASYCKMLEQFKVQEVDVGKVEDRYFLNVAAGGVLTDIAYKTSTESKTVLGTLAYFINGAIDLPGQLWQSVPIKIVTEEKTIEDEIMLFIISNSKSVGGFRNLAPQARVDDGLLDVLVVHKMSWFDFLPLLFQLINGEHVLHKDIEYFQTKKLHLSCSSPSTVPLDLDGEQGNSLPVNISIKEKAIRLLVP